MSEKKRWDVEHISNQKREFVFGLHDQGGHPLQRYLLLFLWEWTTSSVSRGTSGSPGWGSFSRPSPCLAPVASPDRGASGALEVLASLLDPVP